jgi:hypothetical protein
MYVYVYVRDGSLEGDMHQRDFVTGSDQNKNKLQIWCLKKSQVPVTSSACHPSKMAEVVHSTHRDTARRSLNNTDLSVLND